MVICFLKGSKKRRESSKMCTIVSCNIIMLLHTSGQPFCCLSVRNKSKAWLPFMGKASPRRPKPGLRCHEDYFQSLSITVSSHLEMTPKFHRNIPHVFRWNSCVKRSVAAWGDEHQLWQEMRKKILLELKLSERSINKSQTEPQTAGVTIHAPYMSAVKATICLRLEQEVWINFLLHSKGLLLLFLTTFPVPEKSSLFIW